MNRRSFLLGSAAALTALAVGAPAASEPARYSMMSYTVCEIHVSRPWTTEEKRAFAEMVDEMRRQAILEHPDEDWELTARYYPINFAKHFGLV